MMSKVMIKVMSKVMSKVMVKVVEEWRERCVELSTTPLFIAIVHVYSKIRFGRV